MNVDRNRGVDCLIVGGGFTGLAAAVELATAGQHVVLCERDDALGGLAGGFEVAGEKLEKFYHHWFVSDTHVSMLAKAIGKGDRIVTRKTRTGMYYSGSFFKLSSPLDLIRFTAIPFLDRVRTGLATLAVRRVKDWRSLEGVSARDWLIKLFGRKAYAVIWEPLILGKFGKFSDDISAVWFWNKLALRGGSRAKDGGEALATYLGGFAQFAEDAGAYVTAQGGSIRTGVQVRHIAPHPSGGVAVETSDGTIRARSVLVTVPLPLAADLLAGAVDQAYADSLRRIRFLGNVCLVLEMDRSLSDLYWINVNDPSFPFVGIIEHTNFESPSTFGNRHIVYLSKYLPTDDPLYRMTAEELLAFSIPHLQRMFPSFSPDMVKAAHAWREPYAQPIVERHYSRLIPPFETPVPGVFLASMAQVYPEDRGTNYAVREGHAAAGRIEAYLRTSVPA